MQKIDFFCLFWDLFVDEFIFLLYLESCGVQKMTLEKKWEQLVHYNLQKICSENNSSKIGEITSPSHIFTNF
jgi:hypothetical protein